jgi:hypothetical protein
VSLAYAVLISINSRATLSRMALSLRKAEFRQVVGGPCKWLVRRCNAIAITGARYGIFESARGCCGLPGDGNLHALRAEGVGSRKVDGEATDIGRRAGHGFWTGGAKVGAFLRG